MPLGGRTVGFVAGREHEDAYATLVMFRFFNLVVVAQGSVCENPSGIHLYILLCIYVL